jgi:6-phosphofructokinase 1
VTGRYAGWNALHSRVPAGAAVVLIPEFPYAAERVAACIRQRDALGARFSIVVVAEGARPIDGSFSVIEAARTGHAERLGGAGALCAARLEDLTGKETRYVVLGHLQRGGTPTAFDRTLATRFGGKAVELLRNGQFGKMVANHPPDLVPIPIGEVVGKTKTVPLDYDLLRTARALGVSFGD